MNGKRSLVSAGASSLILCVVWLLGPAATAQDNCCSWSPANCYYGDGSTSQQFPEYCGDIQADTTLEFDVNCVDLHVYPGVTYDTAGYIVRVCGNLTIDPGGAITDGQSGGDGAPGPSGLGRGGNPMGGDGCQPGACGLPGDEAEVPEAGDGGGSGCQGSGGGGALRDGIIVQFDADGGWCTVCGDAEYNDNDRGKGGDGGDGGGYVRVWAFNINSTGHIHADGEDGQVGGEGGDGEYYAYPEIAPSLDLCGGGQGGGAGGDGGAGGTLSLYHPRPGDSLGLYSAAGGAGGSGGIGGQGGDPPGTGCGLLYGIEPIYGHSWPGCNPTCCEQCSPRPCWDTPGCNPCGGRGGDGEWQEGHCCGDGAQGQQGCDGQGGSFGQTTTRPGDYDGDGDEDVVDYYAFLECYPPPYGGPIPPDPPGCEIFDFDCDGDIDPDDWELFKNAWTGPPPGSPPLDVCCISGADPECQDLHVVDCYVADDTPMYPSEGCELPEACCLPNGECVNTDARCCELAEGTPVPGELCTPPAACCDPVTGACTMLDAVCCPLDGGVPYPEEDCTLEACCFPDGTCEMLARVCCELIGGTSVPGEVCTAPEACLLPDCTCVMADALCCVNELGGVPQGSGSVCPVRPNPVEWSSEDVGHNPVGGRCTTDADCDCNDGAPSECYCILDEGGTEGSCYLPCQRYLQVDNSNNSGTSTALRVKLEGDACGPWWVGDPYESGPYPMTIAILVDTPVYRTMWPAQLDVTDCEIVPGHGCVGGDNNGLSCDPLMPEDCPEGVCTKRTYIVQAIPNTGDTGVEGDYSAPLSLKTPTLWGDVVGTCAHDKCLGPNLDVNIDDILAEIRAFQSIFGGPHCQFDIAPPPPNTNNMTNQVVDIDDILAVIAGFQSKPYPGAGPCGC